MKKEARQQAEKVFVGANGKISNVEIGKKVGVNSLTVGKWKKADDWAAKLAGKSNKKEDEARPRPPGKKAAHDEALTFYLESEGKIRNTVLANKVGVSANTIANWKTSEGWLERVKKSEEPSTAPEPLQVQEAAAKPEVALTEEAEEIEIDLEALACPDHITRLNKKIDQMLGRECMTPEDLKCLAEAKEAVLGVVSAYIDIVERCSED